MSRKPPGPQPPFGPRRPRKTAIGRGRPHRPAQAPAHPEPALAGEAAWAVGGGIALLALCLVASYLVASLLTRAGPAATMPGYHAMTGIFLAGTLATFVGRTVGVRTR